MKAPNNGNVLRLIEKNVLEKPEDLSVAYIFPGDPPFEWHWGKLWENALAYAARLHEEGVRKGDVCSILIRHDPRFVPIYLGVAMLGAIPSVLAYPNPRLHPDKFRHGLTGMSRKSGLDWILTEEELEEIVMPLLDEGCTFKGYRLPLTWGIEEGRNNLNTNYHHVAGLDSSPGTPFLLQHSSGTTGLQKAVVLSHSAITEHIRSYSRAICLTREDRIVSWLPLYHDMGLIAAYLMPLIAGIPQYTINPFDWVTAPVLFLEAVSSFRGTLAWLPNFAYNHMANRIQEEDLEGIRLDSLRLVVNCSEPVRKESHELFKNRFVPYGLSPHCLGASYALAENTFAVSQSYPNMEAKSIFLDRQSLQEGMVDPCEDPAKGRWLVSSGTLIDGSRVRILDEEGNDVRERRVGEIAIHSPYMFSGYNNQPETTKKSFLDGWFLSGDMGFLFDRELYVVGRKKDLIIVAGKNIYPEDIEDICSGIPGVIPGRVVAVGIEDVDQGTEGIHVIAETKLEKVEEKKQLSATITRECMNWDFSIFKVHLVPPRWLVKSSAGKPARNTNKERIAAENLSPNQ